MDFDVLHLHQEFRHLYFCRNKDMVHYNIWVTSDQWTSMVNKI